MRGQSGFSAQNNYLEPFKKKKKIFRIPNHILGYTGPGYNILKDLKKRNHSNQLKKLEASGCCQLQMATQHYSWDLSLPLSYLGCHIEISKHSKDSAHFTLWNTCSLAQGNQSYHSVQSCRKSCSLKKSTQAVSTRGRLVLKKLKGPLKNQTRIIFIFTMLVLESSSKRL